MINLPWWTELPKEKLRAIQEQKIFKKMKIFSKSKMPNSEYLSNNGFYLPSGLGISDSEIRYVCTTLNQLLR